MSPAGTEVHRPGRKRNPRPRRDGRSPAQRYRSGSKNLNNLVEFKRLIQRQWIGQLLPQVAIQKKSATTRTAMRTNSRYR